MTPQEINLTIAELCGWTWNHADEWCWEHVDGSTSSSVPVRAKSLPNYHASLDACATFEATLTDVEHSAYRGELWNTAMAETGDLHSRAFVSATAPQRCEAFLRTHNKWIETK